VNFAGADLSGANLANANLNGADLRECKDLTNKQIKEACNWEQAKYLPGKLKELQEDKASDPQEVVDCSCWTKN
jgi:uncharacterized protein YjbI with pentapeptide repeats